jgi:hypothetical protein
VNALAAAREVCDLVSNALRAHRRADDSDQRTHLAGSRRRDLLGTDGVLVQELVPPQGYDLRILVAAERIVGAIFRVAAAGEWRTNVALGGVRRAVADPSAQACELALAAARAAGAALVGVDLVPDGEGGWTVLELNGAVEFTREYQPAGAVGSVSFDASVVGSAVRVHGGGGRSRLRCRRLPARRGRSCRRAPGIWKRRRRGRSTNLVMALADAGAAPGDLVKTTIFVVGKERGDLVTVWNVVSPRLGRVPSTLLGVSLLGYEDQLVEIEGVAVVGSRAG